MTIYQDAEIANEVSTWPISHDDSGHGLWDYHDEQAGSRVPGGAPGKFGQASEDRTASVTLLSFAAENYGYLNVTHFVVIASGCGGGRQG